MCVLSLVTVSCVGGVGKVSVACRMWVSKTRTSSEHVYFRFGILEHMSPVVVFQLYISVVAMNDTSVDMGMG